MKASKLSWLALFLFFFSVSSVFADVNDLKASLIRVTAHYDNTAALSEAQLTNELTIIENNFVSGTYAQAEVEIWNCIDAYDDNQDYVFKDFKTYSMSNMPVADKIYIYLLQTIHEREFVNGNLDNLSRKKFDISFYYPGAVADNAERLNDQQVTLNATCVEQIGFKVIMTHVGAVRPTGYYAAPGEVVSIDIAPALADAGLKVIIGAHQYNFITNVGVTNRFPNITKTFDLNAAHTEIANPFGGGIYLNVPKGVDLGWIDVTISGAVKSPYFSHRTMHKTNSSQWQTELAENNVLWADLESDSYIFTLPVSVLQDLDMQNPTEFLERWEVIMDSAYTWLGGRDTVWRSEHNIVDTKLRSNNHTPGFPYINTSSVAHPASLKESGGMATNMLYNNWFLNRHMRTYLHELGHAAFMPKLGYEREATVNIHAAYVANQLDGFSMDTAMQFSCGESQPFSETMQEWMVSPKFRANENVDRIYSQYQQKGYADYVEMARVFGWESFRNLNKYFFEQWNKFTTQPSHFVSQDDMIRAASISNNINMAPLFHFWGHIPSESLKAELSALPTSMEILRRLGYYKQISPKQGSDLHGNSMFQNFTGKYTDLDKTFDDENYVQQITDQICLIINTYYHDSIDCLTFHEDPEIMNPCRTSFEVVINNNQQLVAKSSGTIPEKPTYQWMDCSTGSDIPGETKKVFEPVSNGEYAVKVKSENCDVLTECFVLKDLSLDDLNTEDAVHIFPNPTDGMVFIKSDTEISKISVVDAFGNLVLTTTGEEFDLSEQSKGIYFLHVDTVMGRSSKRIVLF